LEQKLKRQRRVAAKERCEVYENFDMPPGTSVNCERLFSQAKFILSNTRKRTNPLLFEALLSLKVNGSFWNVFPSGKPWVDQRYQDLKLVVALTMQVMLSCLLILTM
jgi:hypothetical protein